MTSKITMSLDEKSLNLLNSLSQELDMKKNEVFKKALAYYADIVQTSILEKRLKEIDTKQAKIISEDDVFKVLDAD